MNKIALCMIVKNEESVIRRCLESIYSHIDYYVICDTGSSDRTKEIIIDFFEEKKISGEIYDDEWIDFGTNRSKAIERCYGKTKWAIMIDADDHITGNFDISNIDDTYDGYKVNISSETLNYPRIQIFNIQNKKWVYRNPLHEYPEYESSARIGKINGKYTWLSGRDGNRTKKFKTVQEKYLNDYFILKNQSHDNPRNQFYAAQSAFDAGMYDISEKEYLKRVDMGGWDQEIFYSWIKIGQCRDVINKKHEKIINAYINAHEIDNQRIEPLYYLANFFRKIGKMKMAFLYAFSGKELEIDYEKLFVHKDQYLWKIHDEIGISAYYAGNYEAGKNACEKLLRENYIPEDQKGRIKNNLRFYTSSEFKNSEFVSFKNK